MSLSNSPRIKLERRTFSLVLPPDLSNRLFVLSRYVGVSQGQLVRQCLEKYLSTAEMECNYQDFLYPFMSQELLKTDGQLAPGHFLSDGE